MKHLKLTLIASIALIATSAQACNYYCEAVIAGKMSTIAGLTATYKATLAAQIAKNPTHPNFYLPVPRSNDIFTFCWPEIYTENFIDQGWTKIFPGSGTWMIHNRDQFASVANPDTVARYIAVCPYGGMTPGPWKGPATGDKFMASPAPPGYAPFPH